MVLSKKVKTRENDIQSLIYKILINIIHTITDNYLHMIFEADKDIRHTPRD